MKTREDEIALGSVLFLRLRNHMIECRVVGRALWTVDACTRATVGAVRIVEPLAPSRRLRFLRDDGVNFAGAGEPRTVARGS